MLARIKEFFIGPPLSTAELGEKKLNKIRALAAFSPDALSSIAYANQEIYLGLLVAGSAGLALAFPIGLAITGLLAIVGLSYYQTIQGYPSGGGSYVVSRENLGTTAGLITGSALLIDYLLTAAVSITAGVEAIASAIPILWKYRVIVALLLLLIMTLSNLRGLKETGTFMSIPVYLFLTVYLIMLAFGVYRLVTGGNLTVVEASPHATQTLTLALVLSTFSAGCTALTGIEAISNGVPAFKSPEVKNAGRTLIAMTALMAILFIGSIGLTQYFRVIASSDETILSALAHRILGSGFLYYLVQISTMLILVVAANTSFAGFPRLAAILAKDGFLPRQFTGLGDRLVFANGIGLLAVATGFLIVIFRGNSHLLIPLFAVSVFIAYTLSQVGMVRHWWRERGGGWLIKAGINGFGALVTCLALLVIVASKFLHGAWISLLLILLLVSFFYKIRSHYRRIGRELSIHGMKIPRLSRKELRVIIPISGIHRGTVEAVGFARRIARDVTAVYVELDPGASEAVREKWSELYPRIPIVILPSPYRSIIQPLLNYLDETDRQHDDGQQATIVLPEFVPAKWWHSLLHNQTAWLLKAALLYRRRRRGYQSVIIDVPYHLRK
jgi:amino acid transporter